jgi:hypoxanthine phosphoribosyltransferase
MEKLRLLISRGEIGEKVAELAAVIREDYRAKNPLLIGVLKGGFIFMADLVRALNIPLEVEFIRLSSYRAAKVSTGKIKIVQGLRTTVTGRDVLIIEDIVDTGHTVRFLIDYLRRRKPASLKLCALFDKPSRRVVDVPIDYLGFTIPYAFVVGYGLDLDERFRYLPDLCILAEDES